MILFIRTVFHVLRKAMLSDETNWKSFNPFIYSSAAFKLEHRWKVFFLFIFLMDVSEKHEWQN